MRRHWPIAFLALLFALLLGRPSPPPASLERSVSRAVPESLPEEPPTPSPSRSEAPATPPTAEPDPPADNSDEPWKRSAVGASMHWLVWNQNEDGSWGDVPTTIGGRTIGKTGVTSLALITMLGAGYSHLSKDEFGDRSIGETVKKGLRWLIDDQREDGTCKSGYEAAFDQALASLAISEAYGMTASQPLKEPAQRAVDALVRMQDAGGSWGSPEITVWAIHALCSAELSELSTGAKEVQEQALRALGTAPHPGNGVCRIFLNKRREAATSDVAALEADVPQDDGRDFVDWFHGSNTLFQFDGPEGPRWNRWNEPMKRAILSRQNRDGSWTGGTASHTVARSSLAALTLEVYYRYANIYGNAR